jgi:hypothetical protein
MLGLFGIRPNRLLIAVAGIVLLVAGLVVDGPVMMTFGGLAIAWSAITFIAARRQRAR